MRAEIMEPISFDEVENIEEVKDEMELLLLGNRMARCAVFGDAFRPLLACYRHSHGEFLMPLARTVLEECVGCTRWLKAVETQAGADEVREAAPKKKDKRKAERGAKFSAVCQCGNSITTNMTMTDCIKCGRIHVFE